MFITFEGIEGCGKTTQVNRLKEYFESLGKEVLVTLEPGGSRLGKTLRKILLSMESQDLTREAELFLYLADRHSMWIRLFARLLNRDRLSFLIAMLILLLSIRAMAGAWIHKSCTLLMK